LQIFQRRRKLWKTGQLIVSTIEHLQGRRKTWKADQWIVGTTQRRYALRKRREFCQSQSTEIEFSVDTVHNTLDCDFHG
jgi:hypothetical protein